MKYPYMTPYIRTGDSGMELRYSLRSLENITNFNGEVLVVGEKERWFGNLTYIPSVRKYGKTYLDQVHKLLIACENMPGKFICSMDDIYITRPTRIGFYNKGKLTGEGTSYHQRTKAATRNVLLELGFTDPVDYECHAPYLVERDKLKETLEFILSRPEKETLQWRSLYGNMHRPETEFMIDQKTKTANLADGAILSTGFYTNELHTLFPNLSKYEIM